MKLRNRRVILVAIAILVAPACQPDSIGGPEPIDSPPGETQPQAIGTPTSRS